MKKKFITITVLAFILISNAYGQIELIFSAKHNGSHITLDSIFVENLPQNGDTTLYYPDTVLVLEISTGISDYDGTEKNNLSVSQNYPNPFEEHTSVNVFLPESEFVTISIFDVLGRELAHFENTLNAGNHSFTFYPGKEKYYLFSVRTSRDVKSIKMINIEIQNGAGCRIVYDGSAITNLRLKLTKSNFVFALGDQLRYIGYATSGSGIAGSDVIADIPMSSESYLFEIINGMPCPGTPTVSDIDGNIYKTIQIGNQCWMKENLNYGTMINGTVEQTNNGTPEKYCYGDLESNCTTYGGLYQWDEMMQYTTAESAQGICPTGWHIPSDDEWKVLEMALGMTQAEADISNAWRGVGVGTALKEGGTSGFEARLSGGRWGTGAFNYINTMGYFWTSTESGSNAWRRCLSSIETTVGRWNTFPKTYGFSVRCVKD